MNVKQAQAQAQAQMVPKIILVCRDDFKKWIFMFARTGEITIDKISNPFQHYFYGNPCGNDFLIRVNCENNSCIVHWNGICVDLHRQEIDGNLIYSYKELLKYSTTRALNNTLKSCKRRCPCCKGYKRYGSFFYMNNNNQIFTCNACHRQNKFRCENKACKKDKCKNCKSRRRFYLEEIYIEEKSDTNG